MNATAKSSPRVLFLDHVGVLGGAELNLVDMARHCRDRGHVVLFADGPLRPILEKNGVTVGVLTAAKNIASVRRGSGLIKAFKTVPQVFSLARKVAREARKFDLIWANSQKSFVIGCFAALLSRRPLVWHMHDILTADHFSPSNRKIAVLLANIFASQVVAVSKAGLQSFVDCGGREELARTVYNGIDPSNFVAVDAVATRRAIRSELSLGEVPTVGVFGRLTPWKGQHILIRALTMLPGVHAVFVGEALFDEDEYAASLPALAKELGVADRVHFAGFRTDVAETMSAMDVIAHTSTAPEPFGRVIVEAMLARKPVVATAAGGAAEIVTHGHDGVLLPPGQSRLLADALRDLFANPDKAARLAAEGFDTAYNEFSLEAYLSAVDRVMLDVAKPDALRVRRQIILAEEPAVLSPMNEAVAS